ncbi:MAG TPA: c-type cytochrome [Polyangiaceae bacterium]|jgi:mono/diheme cytochrome c family protein
MARSFSTLILFTSLALAACSKSGGNENVAPSPPSPSMPSTVDTAAEEPVGPGEAQALSIFKTRCSTCHGMEGKGNGPASLTLNPKPRNYTDVNWQKSVTDDHIREIIVKGGAAVGKSALMPPNPDLADKPAVVEALMKKVRSFAGTGGSDGGTDAGAAK